MRTIVADGLTLEPQLASHAEHMFAMLSDPAAYQFELGRPPSVEWLRVRFAMLAWWWSTDGGEQWLDWVIRAGSGELVGYVQAMIDRNDSAATCSSSRRSDRRFRKARERSVFSFAAEPWIQARFARNRDPVKVVPRELLLAPSLKERCRPA